MSVHIAFSPRILQRSSLLRTLRQASSKAAKRTSRAQAATPLRSLQKTASTNVLSAKRTSPVSATSSTPLTKLLSPNEEITDVVAERPVYEFKGEYHLGTDARFLIGFGLMVFLICANGADLIRRPPKQPTDPNAPRVEGWPAWKRWGLGLGLFGTGSAILTYAYYWPSRIVQKISLHARNGARLPAREFSRNAQYTTPYRQCDLRIETISHTYFPKVFSAKVVPFENVRLLGPLSTEPKWWHPPSSTAFSEVSKKNGRLPSNVPIQISEKQNDTYSIRRAEGVFVDPEGLERALLENSGIKSSIDLARK